MLIYWVMIYLVNTEIHSQFNYNKICRYRWKEHTWPLNTAFESREVVEYVKQSITVINTSKH